MSRVIICALSLLSANVQPMSLEVRPTPTPEELDALRRARQSARALWKRNVPMGRIEEQLLRDGFGPETTQITMHHLFGEFLKELERSERLFRFAGAGFVAAGVAIFAVTFLGDVFTGRGFSVFGVVIVFGALLIARGFWLRARIRATRRHRWMAETPQAGDREGGAA